GEDTLTAQSEFLVVCRARANATNVSGEQSGRGTLVQSRRPAEGFPEREQHTGERSRLETGDARPVPRNRGARDTACGTRPGVRSIGNREETGSVETTAGIVRTAAGQIGREGAQGLRS